MHVRQKNAFLLFEVLISGVVLAIWLGSLTLVLQQIQHENKAVLTWENDLTHADSILTKILADQPVESESVLSHPFSGGLRLIQIQVGRSQNSQNSYWVVVP